MTFRRMTALFALIAPLMLLAPQVSAQNIEKAIKAYKKKSYEESAARFYEVLRFSEDDADTAEAQYGLASSLDRMDMPFAAFIYYQSIVESGAEHPYFTKALEGLVDTGTELNDELKMPEVLDSMYERNINALRKMNKGLVQRIHFVIGKRLFRAGNAYDAENFLKTVKEGNEVYPDAQYLLGLLYLQVGVPGAQEPGYAQAADAFNVVLESIPTDHADEARLRLRDLALLALARTYYEEAYARDDEDPKRKLGMQRAISLYRQVPRFSGAWSDALFERGWAHTVATEYGKGLGALHSLNSPFFENSFFPEADILTAIIYWYNCQWDRANETIVASREKYEPMIEELGALLQENFDDEEWYMLLKRSLDDKVKDGPRLPRKVALKITAHPRYKKFQTYLSQIERERKVFKRSKIFAKGEIGRELGAQSTEARDKFAAFMGLWIKRQVAQIRSDVDGVVTRAQLISLETKTAEARWLEAGRQIENRIRRRLPRPFVPDDTFQFWWFRDEFWVDEVGYFEYSVKTECFE